jgi:hypothetical protein
MWDRSIRDASDFASTLAYIMRNPVEAGLVDDSDAYRWLWVADVEA